MITVRPASLGDACWIGERLRVEDEEEVEAATGQSGRTVVPSSFRTSTLCFSIFGVGEKFPCAITGVSPDSAHEGWGVVWLLATDRVTTHSRAILKEAGRWLDLFQGFCPNGLHNLVYAKNSLHLRWCLGTGFKLGDVVHHRNSDFIHVYRLPHV